mmetsp:Transcript_106420/g.338913  ORF Transcript_106420/g.338913 Transcript_106420/m.338913 type:complete len:277 (+) Transcript_106420:647-1477(+)
MTSATRAKRLGTSASLHRSAPRRAYSFSRSSSRMSPMVQSAASTLSAHRMCSRSSCTTKGSPKRAAAAQKQYFESTRLLRPPSMCAANTAVARQLFSPSRQAGASRATRPRASTALSAALMSSGGSERSVPKSATMAWSSSGSLPGSACGARPQAALPMAAMQCGNGTGLFAWPSSATSAPRTCGNRATSPGATTCHASWEITSTPLRSTALELGARAMASSTAPRPLSWPSAHTAASSSSPPRPRTPRRARASGAPASRSACACTVLPSTSVHMA